MKLLGSWVAWGLVSVAAALAFAGCGGVSSSGTPDPSDGRTAGAAGETAEATSEGGASAGGAGEAGGGGEGGDPDAPEETFPLSSAEVARLAFTNFITSADPGRDCFDGNSYDLPLPELGFLQLAFVANDAEGIDVITSTQGPWLSIQRSHLLRTQSGYVVEPPPPTVGCMVYEFEDGYRPEWSTPTRLVLDFSANDHEGKFTSMSLRARFGRKTLKATGIPDVVAPRIVPLDRWAYEPSDKLYYSEDLPSWSLPRHFGFSEALRPGWSIALENDAGDHFEVAASNEHDLATGFDVVQFFPPGFHWVVTGRDFAGNALEASQPYPSMLPAVDSGTFEVGDSWLSCDSPDLQLPDSCVAAVPPDYDDVPALSGERSLLIGWGGVTLRIARMDGASNLLFQARLVGYSDSLAPIVYAHIQPLDAGSSARMSRQITLWSVDPELSSATSAVSLAREVSLNLPAGTGDVLLELESDSPLWIDSVRTE